MKAQYKLKVSWIYKEKQTNYNQYFLSYPFPNEYFSTFQRIDYIVKGGTLLAAWIQRQHSETPVYLSQRKHKQKWTFMCLKTSVIVMPMYLHKAFDIRETRHKTLSQYLRFHAQLCAIWASEASALPFSPTSLLCRMHAIWVIKRLWIQIDWKPTKWQFICYSRCFYMFSIGKSQSSVPKRDQRNCCLFFNVECFDFLFSLVYLMFLYFSLFF